MNAVTLGTAIRTFDGHATLMECEVTIPGSGSRNLWIRTTGEGRVHSNDSAAVLGLLPAMKLGVPLVSEGPVSRTLLDCGLPAVQRIHTIWHSDRHEPDHGLFTLVDVSAAPADDLPAEGGVGVFFSGGVDSSFSLLDARDEVTDLVFIHDFEAPFPPDQRLAALAGVERIADAFGKRLIEVETNAKEVFAGLVSWAHFHGALLAAVALELQGQMSVVHVPSSADVSRINPWGSHPLLDPLWSTSSIRIVHDRLDVTRLQKTAAIAGEGVLLDNLRVCWAPHQNCGRCGKCVRTVFTLQALGLFERGRPFDRPPVTAAELARVEIRTPGVARQFQQVADLLIANNSDPDLVRAVRIASTGWHQSRVGRLFRGDLRGRVHRRLSSAVRRGSTPR